MTSTTTAPPDLQQAARDHLWLHFTRMGGYRDAEVPIIVRGDGCYLEDANGKRYLDALAGLFSVNLGYGFGEEMGQAALEADAASCLLHGAGRTRTRAIELAREVTARSRRATSTAPFRLRRLRGVRSAWKLAWYFLAGGKIDADETRNERRRWPRKYKAIAPGRLPQDDDGRALDQRHPRPADAVRAARARCGT